MAGSVEHSVLRQMAKPVPKARGRTRDSGAALRAALLREAQKVPGLVLTVRDLGLSGDHPADTIEEGGPGALLLRLVDGDGRPGLAVVDPELLQGLIELQICGHVSSRKVRKRAPTAADLALLRTLLEPWLAALALAADPRLPEVLCDGWYADDRAALLDLDAPRWTALRLSLDLNEGQRLGELAVFFPVAGGAASGAGGEPDRMASAISPLPVTLEVVLCRTRVTLARARTMAVGDVLPLEQADLRNVSIRLPGGEEIARGHLGQSAGKRALRVHLKGKPASPPVAPATAGGGGVPEPAPAPEPLPPLGDLPDLPPLGDLPDLPPLS